MAADKQLRKSLSDNPGIVVLSTAAALVALITYAMQVRDRHVVIPAGSLEARVQPAFIAPNDGDSVGTFTEVSYSGGAMPRGFHRELLVRDPLGQYWAWGPLAQGEHRRVQVGTDDNSGASFEIGLLTTSEYIPPGRPIQVRPEGDYVSVTVTRR